MKQILALVALAAVVSSSSSVLAQEKVATSATVATTTAHEKKSSGVAKIVATKSGIGTVLVMPTGPGWVSTHPARSLSDVRGSSVPITGSGAEQREVVVVVGEVRVAPTVAATPRLLRRMHADAVVAKLSLDFHACYATVEADKTPPAVVVRLDVQSTGSISRAIVESTVPTTAPVSICISSAALLAKFSPPGGNGTTVLVPVRTH